MTPVPTFTRSRFALCDPRVAKSAPKRGFAFGQALRAWLAPGLAPGLVVLLAACSSTPTVVRYNHVETTNPRKLAIFLDGSANNYQTRSNVRRLFELVANQDRPDIAAYYQEGVGGPTHRLTGSPLSAGTLLGSGIGEGVTRAYRFLAENYRVGGEAGRPAGADDQVYLFGYSRGAYTARVLAGMMDLFGGVPDLTRYDSDAGANLAERFYVAYKIQGKACGPDGGKRACAKAEARTALLRQVTRPLRIHSLGLWDTVRSLGLEAVDCAVTGVWNPNQHDHAFHREKLYGNVERAYHVLALDERRACFYPLLLRPAEGSRLPRVLEEVWFSGDHASVGGDDPNSRHLAGVTLSWMIEQLDGSGLLPDGMSRYVHQSAMGAATDLSGGMFEMLGKRRRDRALANLPPDAKPKLHVSVVQRLLRSRCDGAREPYAPSPVISYLNGAPLDEASLRDAFTIIGPPPETCPTAACGC